MAGRGFEQVQNCLSQQSKSIVDDFTISFSLTFLSWLLLFFYFCQRLRALCIICLSISHFRRRWRFFAGEVCDNVREMIFWKCVVCNNFSFVFTSSLRLSDASGVRGDPRPEIGALLRNGTCDCRTLHLTLIIHYDSRVVLEIEEGAVLPPEGLPLPDDDGGHDFLAELWLALLDGGQDHVTGRGGRQTVQATADTADGDDVQILGAGVVGAVDDGAHGQTQGNTELCSC